MFRYFVTYLHWSVKKTIHHVKIYNDDKTTEHKKSTLYSETKRIYYRKSSHKYPKHTTNITDELICLTSIKYKFGQMYLKTSHSSVSMKTKNIERPLANFTFFLKCYFVSWHLRSVLRKRTYFCKIMFLHKAKANPDKWHAMYFSFTIGLESALPLFYETQLAQLYKKGWCWSDLTIGSFKHHLNSPVSVNNTI